MSFVRACLDAKSHSTALLEAAQWAAQRLQAPLSLLHVLEPHPERAPLADYSGAIGLGAQEALLGELSELDRRRATLAQEAGRQMLQAAAARVAAAGQPAPELLLRHGELAEVALELQSDTRLFVLGEHARPRPTHRLHLDQHLERLVRAVERPVLVLPGERFQALVAFDGSPTALRAVQRLAASPLLQGLPLRLVSVGGSAPADLGQAQQQLEAAGFAVQAEQHTGEPEQVLPRLAAEAPQAWLVMGAYGHSRIRQLVLGSATSTLLRLSTVPVLVLR